MIYRDKNGKFCSKDKSVSTQVKIGKNVKVTFKAKETPKELQKVLKNRVIFVLDESGSMHHLRNTVIEKYNKLLGEFRENAQKFNQRTEVSTYLFSYSNRKVKDCENVNVTGSIAYNPQGGTALFDAVGQAIVEARNSPDYSDPDTSFLVLILTDGEENSSKIYNQDSLSNLIKQVDQTQRWTVTFQVPPGSRNRFLSMFPLYSDNVREWEATEEGMRDVETVTSGGIVDYYNTRSKGLTRSLNFFSPDMSNLKGNVNKLYDLSSQFEEVTVPSGPVEIKKFVENSGRPWIKGAVFYEIPRTTIVQHNKNILVQNKTTGTVHGGKEARDILGFPDKNVKVNPVNHPEWRLYSQSTSVNRRLGVGQKLLIKK